MATAEAVDEVFKLGMNHPMGPLTLADFIGLDVCLDIMRVLQERAGRSEVPAVPAADQDGGRGVVREEERARILHVLIRTIARFVLSRILHHGGTETRSENWFSLRASVSPW